MRHLSLERWVNSLACDLDRGKEVTSPIPPRRTASRRAASSSTEQAVTARKRTRTRYPGLTLRSRRSSDVLWTVRRVCVFGDNRQCEEWALMRGQCPAGGIRVTGYVTPPRATARSPVATMRSSRAAAPLKIREPAPYQAAEPATPTRTTGGPVAGECVVAVIRGPAVPSVLEKRLRHRAGPAGTWRLR
jgi:hypothetical protein